MRHRASRRFWRCYRALPANVRNLADRSYTLLKSNPSHRSLQFRKIGNFWSTRIGLHYRALAVEAGGDRVWFWIGSHAAQVRDLLGHASIVTTERYDRQRFDALAAAAKCLDDGRPFNFLSSSADEATDTPPATNDQSVSNSLRIN